MKMKKNPRPKGRKESHVLASRVQTAENWRRRRRKMSGMISSKV